MDKKGSIINPPPHVGLLLLLAMTLPVAQMVMREAFRYEPFPTLLLPSGATLFRDSGDTTFVPVRELYVSAGNVRHRISYGSLLAHVPDGLQYPIVNRGFGLTPARTPGWIWGGDGWDALLPRGETTSDEVEIARRWLQRQASLSTGQRADSIVIVVGERVLERGTLLGWRIRPRETVHPLWQP